MPFVRSSAAAIKISRPRLAIGRRAVGAVHTAAARRVQTRALHCCTGSLPDFSAHALLSAVTAITAKNNPLLQTARLWHYSSQSVTSSVPLRRRAQPISHRRPCSAPPSTRNMHRSHSISLPQRLVLPLRGAPLPNALILCDCDGDGDVELCVGTTDGYVPPALCDHLHALLCKQPNRAKCIACFCISFVFAGTFSRLLYFSPLILISALSPLIRSAASCSSSRAPPRCPPLSPPDSAPSRRSRAATSTTAAAPRWSSSAPKADAASLTFRRPRHL